MRMDLRMGLLSLEYDVFDRIQQYSYADMTQSRPRLTREKFPSLSRRLPALRRLIPNDRPGEGARQREVMGATCSR